MALKRRTLLWLLVPLTLVIAGLVALQPLVDWKTRQVLAVFTGYTTTYEAARFRFSKLDYRLTGVKIMKESAGGAAEPFAAWDVMEMSVDWRELLHRHIVARIGFEKLVVHLIAAKQQEERQLDPEIPDLSDKLAKALPLTVARVSVSEGELFFVDKSQPEFPRVWLHDLDATVENLSTRLALAKGEPTILAFSSVGQKSALVSAYVTADPVTKGLFFSGRFEVRGLELVELKDLLSSETGLQFDEGTLDLFAEFDCREGRLSGGVKPVIKNGHIVQGKPDLGNVVKAVLADAALSIFADRTAGKNTVATVIPINGRVTRPDVQLWPTVIGVVRNAFVEGVSQSYANLPPPTSATPEGAIPQLINGLDKNAGPPKAQPKAAAPLATEVR
jgi:Domain of Unknown Function (DUF748)